MSYDERVMQYQQSTITSVMRSVSVWNLVRELYKRFEAVLLIGTVWFVLVGALIKAIG